MVAKTMTGARAQLIATDPTTNTSGVVGIFNSVGWGLNYDVQPIFILGRHSAAETVYTAQDTVHVTATGWRTVGAGAHAAAKVPNLRDLMNHEYMSLAVYDRQSNQRTGTIRDVRPTGYSTSVSARGTQEITVNFIGILVDEENMTNAEQVGASVLG